MHLCCLVFQRNSFSLAGAPLGIWRRMERGGESPITQDSPERRGAAARTSASASRRLGRRDDWNSTGARRGHAYVTTGPR
ncbi:hypothetical protein INR49_021234 [Caranx melampygus]|nr:hypothetical protein INR49_021234 [Caranx melampygus]